MSAWNAPRRSVRIGFIGVREGLMRVEVVHFLLFLLWFLCYFPCRCLVVEELSFLTGSCRINEICFSKRHPCGSSRTGRMINIEMTFVSLPSVRHTNPINKIPVERMYLPPQAEICPFSRMPSGLRSRPPRPHKSGPALCGRQLNQIKRHFLQGFFSITYK